MIGGGLAGAAAALTLVRGGRSVVLVERSDGPHDKVCGEFLSGEALDELEGLGIAPAAHGAAALTEARVAARGAAHASRLPFRAASLTRRVLDEAMLEACAAAGVRVRRGAAVTRAEREGDGWRVETAEGGVLHAETLIAATGKHDLRGGRRPEGIHGDLVGLKAYFRAPNGPRASVDLVFFPDGYCGFQPVEDGTMNACLVVSRDRLRALGGDPWAVFGAMRRDSVHADALMAEATPTTERPLAIGRVPYGYVRGASDGAYHVGDQAAVIPSFCGEGMALALRSGRLAGEAILSGVPADAFQRRFARLAGPRVRGAALLSRLLCRPGVQPAAAWAAGAVPGLVSGLAAVTRTPTEGAERAG